MQPHFGAVLSFSIFRIYISGYGHASDSSGTQCAIPIEALLFTICQPCTQRLSTYLCLAFCSGINHIYAAAILCIEETAYNHVTLYIYSLKGQSWEKYSLRHIIRQGLNGLFYIFRKELKATIKDQGVLIFFLLVPLAYPLIYAFIYTNEVVREVPTAVVDANNSSQSRKYIRMVDGSPDVHIQSYCADMEEARLLLKDQKVYGIIYIPESFSQDLAEGKQAHVSIYCDMSGMLYYKAILLANTETSLKMNKEIQVKRLGNTTERQDEISTTPIEYESVSLFNPQDGFASFLIPAVLILIIQQTLLLGVGLSAGTARENNRFRDLVPISRQYQGTLRIVLGKSLAYLMIYTVMSTYILCLVPKIFSLVQIAQPATLFWFTLPYLLACIFFAMTCSIFVHHRESCMLIFVFTSVPLLFISGISWPGAAIPKLLGKYSHGSSLLRLE